MPTTQTEQAYARDWAQFSAWCADLGFTACPSRPETVALYVASLDQSGTRVSTIRRRLAAIAAFHRSAGCPSPTTVEVVRDAVEVVEQVQRLAPRGKAPIFPDALRQMVRHLPDSLIGIRDRALLLVGHAGALRRSELVALDVADVHVEGDDLELIVRDGDARRSHRSRTVRLPARDDTDLCAVRATTRWLDQLGPDGIAGPVFRPINRHGHIRDQRLSDRSVSLIVKRAAQVAGLDADRYAGHSLRSGARVSEWIAE